MVCAHAPLPSQKSSVQVLVSVVQAVLVGLKLLAGQSLLTPLQFSATSHSPTAGRHTAVLLASAGQLVLVPLHCSAGSHSPAEARHCVPAFPAGCVHVSLEPSH